MQVRVFKPTYTDRKSGKQKPSPKWYVEFRDHNLIRRRWPAFADQSRASSMGQRLARLVECRRAGDMPDPDLQRWLDALPDDIQKRMIEADLLIGNYSAKSEPLSVKLEGASDADDVILKPGYKHHLLAQGDSSGHVQLTISRAKRILEGCGFNFWRDLTVPGAVTRVETFLGDLRTKGEISGQTVNYYARAMRSFCKWLAGTLNTLSPMANLKGVRDADVDKVESRPLSVEELRWVIETNTKGDQTREKLTAAERNLLYEFAYQSGIRPGQIRQLAVSAFDFDSNPPTVTAAAATVKRRKKHVQALLPSMAAKLKKDFENKLPGALAFRMPDKFTCAEVFRADLADARAAWLKAVETMPKELEKRQRSDFLAAVDHEGRRVNFYSLRHTHGTMLGAAGVPQKDIQSSLHHTRSQTTDRYVHSDIFAKAKAVGSLPQAATGTDGGSGGSRLSIACPSPRHPMASGGVRSKKEPRSGEGIAVFSERDGARTRNHRIDSPDNPPGFLAEIQQNAILLAHSLSTGMESNRALWRLVEAWEDLPSDLKHAIGELAQSKMSEAEASNLAAEILSCIARARPTIHKAVFE